jgi:hypothetical protein
MWNGFAVPQQHAISAEVRAGFENTVSPLAPSGVTAMQQSRSSDLVHLIHGDA